MSDAPLTPGPEHKFTCEKLDQLTLEVLLGVR